MNKTIEKRYRKYMEDLKDVMARNSHWDNRDYGCLAIAMAIERLCDIIGDGKNGKKSR